LSACAAIAVVAMTTSVRASDHHGFYVGLEGGWVKVQDSDLPTLGYTDLVFNHCHRWLCF
jgi:hypothetical protein